MIRETKYCTTEAEAQVDEIRLERITLKETGGEEIRMSWWPEGRFAPRPADIEAHKFPALVGAAVAAGVFTEAEKTAMRLALGEG